jgi:hypothetical protein
MRGGERERERENGCGYKRIRKYWNIINTLIDVWEYKLR